jgi:hypothetical protein
VSEEHRCPRCNAPFWHFTGVNTRKFECGSDTQIPSMACRYASQLQERIKRLEDYVETLEECGDSLFNSLTRDEALERWKRAKEAKP